MAKKKSFKDWSMEQAINRQQNPFITPVNSQTRTQTSPSMVTPMLGGGLYKSLLEKSLLEASKYAQQNPSNVFQLANSLAGKSMYTPKTGDLSNWDFDTARQGVLDRVAAINALSGVGMFDKADFAYDPMYSMLPSLGFLKKQLDESKASLTKSIAKDEEVSKRNSSRANNWQHWSDMKNRLGEKTEENEPYFWAFAEYLQNGDTTKPFDANDYLNKYNQAWDEMSDEEYWADIDKRKNRFEALDWGTLTNKDASVEDQLYKSETSGWKEKVNGLQKEITRRGTVAALEQAAREMENFNALSVYNNPGYTPVEPRFADVASAVYAKAKNQYVGQLSDLQYFINSGKGYSAKMAAAEHDAAVRKYLDAGYDYLTADEIAVYNALYSQDLAKAQEYLDAKSPELLMRRAQVHQAHTETLATNPWTALPTWAAARAQGVLNVAKIPQQIYEAAKGNDNPYSSAYDMLNRQAWTGQAQTEVLNNLDAPDWVKKATTYAYKGLTGAADNATRLLATGANPTAALIIAGLQSGSGSLQESASRDDMPAAAKIIKAIGAGAMEIGTEKIGLDALFDQGKKGAMSYIKNVIASELGEETINYLSEDALESVVSFLFDYEADIKSGDEFWQGLTDTWITTAISGGLMGAGGATGNYLNTSSTGADVKNQGAAEAILSIAEGMQDGSQAKQTAAKIREKQGKNKKVTNYQLGQVTQQLATELDEENSRIVDQVMDDAITDRLVELGEDKATAQKNASAIRKLSRGQKLTMDERMAVKWSDNATQVVKELSRETAAQDGGQRGAAANAPTQQAPVNVPVTEAEGQRTGQKWVTVMKKTADGETAGVRGKQMMMNAARSGLTVSDAANEAVKNAAAKVKVTKSGKVSGKTTSAAVNYTDNGVVTEGELVRFEKKNGQMKAVINANKETKEIPLEELTQYEGSGVAAIAQYIQENDGGSRLHDMTTQEANAMLNTYQAVGGDARTYIDAFEETYLAGYAGVEAPTFAVNPRIRDIAYAEGQREAQLDEEARKERAGTYRAVEAPQTGWLGKVTNDSQLTGGGDTEAITAAMEGMTESQRATAEAAMAIGNAAGLNVALYESDLSSGNVANGKFSRSSHTIYLDVNAGAATAQGVQAAKNEGSLGFAIIRTMGHELTHYLEAASPEMYGKYKQAVREALKANQQDMAVLIREKLDRALNSGRKLTYAGAEAEVIADASEYMLEQSTFVEKMEPSLKDRVKSWVQGFMDKIRTAFSHLVGGHKESAALREVVNGVNQYTGKLQELWDASLMEAAQRGTEAADQSGEATEMVEDDQFSHRDQTDTPEFRKWFTDSEVVNEDGSPKIVYHTTRNQFTEFDRKRIGESAANASDGYLEATAHIGFWFNTRPLNSRGVGGNVMPVYLSAQRMNEPGTLDGLTAEIWDVYGQFGYEYDTENPTSDQAREAGEVYRDYLESRGYDGIVVDDTEFGGRSYVVFEPTQIKSATDNVGTFDPENPDIRYSDRDLPDAVSIREYLGSMQVTNRMTETEKILLKRYQENLKALAEKERQAAEQDAILRTATGDELTKAKNRYQIYRTQANRLNRALLAAEKDEGFARLMATSQRVVNDYLLGSSGAVADAADALETEIADLSKRLKSLEAEVTRTSSGQRTAFARGLFDQKMLNEAAEGLKNSYGSRMSVKAIADRLALAYGELYAGEGAEGARNFSAAAKDLATDLLRGNKFRYKSEILPLLTEKIGSISLTETDRQEIRNAGISVTEYRRMLSPYIKVVEGGSDLASYASRAQYYGEGTLAAILGNDVEGNLAMQLYNVISEEKAREADVSFEGMSEAELIGMAMADIAGANLPVNTAGSATTYLRNELMKYAGESAAVAQAIDEAVSRAEIATQRAGSVWREAARDAQTARQAVEYYRKLDETRRLMELQEQKQAITEELKSDNAKKLTEKVQQYREEYRAREQKAREYRYARQDLEKLRRGIGRKVKRLNTLRMRETDQKHVPEELKRIADTVMQTFTDTSLSKLAFAPAKTASLARQYRALKEVESDASYYWDDEVEAELDNLQALGEAYTALREREGGMPSNVSLEGVQLENEILQGVDNIVSNVLQMIDSENDAFLKGRTETFEQFANKAGNALLQHKDYKQFRGMLGQGQKFVDEMLRKGNMTPIYFFEHLRNPEMKDVFDEIRRGQSHYAQIVAEGKAYVQEMKNKYHYGAWAGDGVLKMKTGQGHSIELTREEAAEIYAIAERERRNALYQTEHLLVGGFQYKDVKNKGDGKTQIKNEPNKLNAADLQKIRNWLTEDQKAYADALVGYLSNQMAEYGNEASMAMYGYRKFTEKYYIPFHTVSEQRFQRGDEGPKGEDAGTGRLKSSGFTKKLQHKANATLYIGGLTDTVADHIHKMASYAAMVEPIENMKRLMNHKVIGNDGTTNTIRALIGQKYGQASQDYMTQLLKDLNGSTQSDNRASGFTDKLIGAFKRGAVLASASVVLQQPTAAARAMAYISPKYFAQNPFYRPGKGTWDELTKYSGTAVIKDMGKFDVGLGMTARQYIADENLAPWEAYRRLKAESKTEAGKAAYKRAIDWLTAAPGMADQWTWGLIWKAVKAEQAAMHPNVDHNSEEFLQLCGERFDDVIDHTQVYDSVLTRSNLMRSTNALHKMATSFMSEPTLSINMLYDALAGNHSKGKRAAIIGGVITSQVLAGALAALAQAWNDDEDKRNWAERYTDRAVSNVVDNLNPLGMIPYVSDIMSMFAGYEVERPDMSVIKDIMDYTSTFFDKATDPEKTLTWKDYENFIGTLANLTGLPAKNISREMRRTWNMVVNSQWTTPNATNLQFVALESTGLYGGKNTEYYERMVNAYLRGDEERAEDYRTYMLTSKMVAEDKLQTGLKTAMKEAYIAGDTDEDTAVDYLLKIGSYAEEDDAYWEVDKWQYMRDTGSTADSYRKYADFFQAVETGTNLKATIQVYLDNGVSKTTLASQITNQYKKQLIALKQSGKGYADLQARILTAYEALGYDRAKKLKDIQKWFE